MMEDSSNIGAGALSVLLFHVAVALAAIVPRLPNDRPFPYSIGGDLSLNFRRVMLTLVICNAIRISCFADSRHMDGTFSGATRMQAFCYRSLKTIESFLRSFLCLLTPYLLQCQLQNRINISSPGRDLMMWVYLVVIVSILGYAIVEMTDNRRYWCIKDLGDALSFIPVYKTLKLYSSIVALDGQRHDARGDMTVQTLLNVEFMALTATLLSAIGYLQIQGPSIVYVSFRRLGFYANLTRLLCHAVLMNSKDEAAYFAKFATTTPSTTTSSFDDDDYDDDTHNQSSDNGFDEPLIQAVSSTRIIHRTG